MVGTVGAEEKNVAEIHAERGAAVVCEGQGATERIESVTSRESAEAGGTGLGALQGSIWRLLRRLANGSACAGRTHGTSVSRLDVGKKRIEPFSHGWVSENGIAQCRVAKSSEHCHLYDGHHFTGLGPDHRKAQNAIAVRFDERLHESAGFVDRSRSQDCGHG